MVGNHRELLEKGIDALSDGLGCIITVQLRIVPNVPERKPHGENGPPFLLLAHATAGILFPLEAQPLRDLGAQVGKHGDLSVAGREGSIQDGAVDDGAPEVGCSWCGGKRAGEIVMVIAFDLKGRQYGRPNLLDTGGRTAAHSHSVQTGPWASSLVGSKFFGGRSMG